MESLSSDLKLPVTQLYHTCDLSKLEFKHTGELESLHEHLGQARAMEALKFGIGIQHEGYNLFLLGSSGLGKNTTVKEILEQEAKQQPTPYDWCYVHNFEQTNKPLILKLAPGQGNRLKQDMRNLIDDLLDAIPAAFETDEYRVQYQAIRDGFIRREDQALEEITAKADSNNIAMIRTPSGWNIGPKKEGKLLTPEDFKELPEDEQQIITQLVEETQDALKRLLLKIPAWQKEKREKVKALNRDVSTMTVGHYAADLKDKYQENQRLVQFIDEIEKDIIDNVDVFRKYAEELKETEQNRNKLIDHFKIYQVNVLVDNSKTLGAPIVFEDNPSYQNLIGRIEHLSQMGTLVTDFSLIKSGALHQANGGYLVLDARKLITSFYAWEGLKRALRSQEIKLESIEQLMSLASTTSLQPEPIPLDLKVILTGSRLLYYLLKQYDPEFDLLFKVEADFSEDMDRTPETMALYARLIATLQQQNQLLPIEKSAVERIIEHASRLAQDGEKVSLHMGNLTDLLEESDYWAHRSNREFTQKTDVEKAISSRLYRSSQIKERLQESILKGVQLIKTHGEAVAEVNGLSVIQLDDYAFGRPSRITATARLGTGKVIDIEREVELGGAIHSKGVMILSAYLAEHYAKELPLSLSASLVFEQSYGGVEGDSASAAELCALLSAIAEIPIKQNLAVTGSINQHGEIQAIGGVNEKIEGFFEICQSRGLTGNQGVIIPASNQNHLMLNRDVVAAVEQGQFAIYAVEKVDQLMALLSGLKTGEADAEGKYPKDSLNGRIQERIQRFVKLHKDFNKTEDKNS